MTGGNDEVEDVRHIGSYKEKLLAVSNEIDAIKTTFSRSAEDLSRIQSMLSLDHLDEISSILDKFENRVAEAERERTEASEGAKKYSEELEKEKERLIKLWDAYKNQEEELTSTEKRIAEVEERAKIAESSKIQLENDLTARINTLSQKIQENEGTINQFDEYKQRCGEFDNIRNNLDGEILALKEENTKKENIINELNSQIEELKKLEDYSEYKEKYETMTVEYEKEKERLTKLYQLYEDNDSECKRLSKENKNWQKWYDSNRDIFNKLFSSAPPIVTTENKVSQDEIKEKKPKKSMKKFKFKK